MGMNGDCLPTASRTGLLTVMQGPCTRGRETIEGRVPCLFNARPLENRVSYEAFDCRGKTV